MLLDWLASFGSLYLEIAPLLIFGLAVAGLLHLLVPEAAVERHLGGRGLLGAVKATFLAIPLPLCSCSVVPVVAGLRRKGAGRGASVSFLVAAPQIGADSFVLTQGLLGLPFALYRAGASFVTALLAGLSESLLPEPPGGDRPPAADARPRRRVWWLELPAYSQELLGSMAGSLMTGLALAALILVFVPDGAVAGLLEGRDWIGRLLMLAVGIPMYVCATASTPIAAALVLKGVSPGAALVFLLTGPATNIVTLVMLRGSLGLRPMLVYLASIAGVALMAGWLLDGLPGLGVAMEHAAHVHGPGGRPWWGLAGAVLLGAMLLWHFAAPLRRRWRKGRRVVGERMELEVLGMTCAHCAGRVVQAVEGTGLAEEAEADPSANRVSFRAKADAASQAGRLRLARAIELAGFEVGPGSGRD